ncbi:MAG: diguanylate cyclase [Chloroflexi bacterium]|nr:diguanylate cyclase [Chloroflexota bacterium]
MKKKFFLSLFIPLFLLLTLFALGVDYLSQQSIEDFAKESLVNELTNLHETLKTIAKENPAGFKNELETLLHSYRIGEEGYAWAMNRKGLLIAYSAGARYDNLNLLEEDAKIFFPLTITIKDTSFKIIGLGDQRRFVAVKPVKNKDLLLAVILPMKEFGPVMIKYRLLLIVIWLLFIGFVYLVSWSAASRAYLPVLHFKEVLNKILNLDQTRRNEPRFYPEELEPVEKELDLLTGKLYRLGEEEPNELTGLPGLIKLQDEIFSRIDHKQPMAAAHVDCNYFTPFNHRYGFERGDGLIRFMGVLIINTIKKKGNPDDFLAHLGGDRFVFITTPDKIDDISSELRNSFDRQVIFHYDEKDIANKSILSKDRQGNIHKYPIMKLTVTAVTNEKKPLFHPLQILDILAEIRKHLKTLDGVNYMKDRRGPEKDEPPPEHEDVPIIKEGNGSGG